jgi:hypothetical protein
MKMAMSTKPAVLYYSHFPFYLQQQPITTTNNNNNRQAEEVCTSTYSIAYLH